MSLPIPSSSSSSSRGRGRASLGSLPLSPPHFEDSSSSAVKVSTRLRSKTSSPTSKKNEVFHFTAVVKDLDRLSLDLHQAHPPSKVRRRNALTEAEFEAAFPSCEAKERLVGLWRNSRGERERPLHKEMEGLSLWEEGERQRKRPTTRNRHRSEEKEGPQGHCIDERPRRMRRQPLRRKGEQQQKCDPKEVASITLHNDLRKSSQPEIVPRSLLHHPVALYRPPTSLVDELLCQRNVATEEEPGNKKKGVASPK